MANNIKGLTVEIGGDTTKLTKALENVNTKTRNLSSELGQINRLLKLDPGNTELLAQKQKVLAEAIANTREKLDTLREAEKQVQEQFKRGEVSEEQVRTLQREIVATEQKLKGYENAAQQTAETLDKLGNEADDAAENVEDMGDSSEKAKDDAEELGSSLDGTLKKGFTVVAAAAAAATAAIVACVESTREYRTAMGKLTTAFETNGHSAEAATETYQSLVGILGETDQAVEAANHLAKLTDNEQDLQKWTEICAGVFATFGDSLPIEGLTEAANETAKVGRVVGPLADAINWATSESDAWNKVLRGNTKALAAFEKATAEGESAEDAFNAALEACSTEQERQTLITDALTGLYKDAATQYKRTNKEVIRANEATDKWNAAMARVGSNLEPVVTDIKLLGVELLESAEKPLKNVANYIRNTFIPALQNVSRWVTTNIPAITGALVAVTAAFVAYKVAVFAAEVAQKGFKAALLATEAAQKLLNIAMAASPWGLVAVAVAGVVAGILAYAKANEEATNKTLTLSDADVELMERANETAEALRDQRAATDEMAGGIMAQMGHVSGLKDELFRLADASGNVQEKDQARVNFILGALNEALGTEYQMTDGVIQKYDELKTSIDEVIAAKTANALLEAHNADYIAAIEAEGEAFANLELAQQEYQAQLLVTQQKEAEAAAAKEELERRLEEGELERGSRKYHAEAGRVAGLEVIAQRERDILSETETARDEAAAAYGENTNEIIGYEEAQAAILEGNYARAVEILRGKSKAYDDFSSDVDEATKEAVAALKREAVNAGLEAERTKKNFENGVKGYTEEMVKEAEQSYEDALAAYADAYADAESVGEDLGSGLSDGMESKRFGLIEKAKSLVGSILSAMRNAADSHSPSRKMIEFAEDMGDGVEIGLESKTKPLAQTARKQVNAIMSAYEDMGAPAGYAVQRSIAARETARQTQAAQATASQAGMLDKILAAIERGQVLTIDGDKLVGATATKYDSTLGLRRALAARGAL